ncbi:MAG: DUF5112 domain-containing protein [Bacteroidaceae bacterium]|nr:DUF5112 domain-containing protein [Bacteroidaceae bacterium]
MLSLKNILSILLSALCIASCGIHNGSESKVLEDDLDSLNQLAHSWRYKNTDSLCYYATMAMFLAREANDMDRQAEALNTFMFERFQKMDFDSIMVMIDNIQSLTNNQIELLIADVMGMKVAQRISDHHAFFTFRNHASRRMERIAEEEETLTAHVRRRLQFARSEYHIVSATYFYYVEQLDRALEEIDAAEPYSSLGNDTSQWLYYDYMRGSGDMYRGKDELTITIGEFDALFRTFTLARSGGYIYFQANSMQALAMMMSNEQQRAFIHLRRGETERYLKTIFSQDSLSLSMAYAAENLFMELQDTFQAACVLRTIGELKFMRGEIPQAISYLNKALALLNGKRLPEWEARVNQHLSMAYAALGDKSKSDDYRNHYLDFLELTREDAEQESRYEELKIEGRRLAWLLVGCFVILIALILLFINLNDRWKKRAEAQEWLLQQALRLTDNMEAVVSNLSYAQYPNEVKALKELIAPYHEFLSATQRQQDDISVFREQIEEEQQATELKINLNKRQNIEKRAKLQLVYSIMPFLDRILEQIHRMERSNTISTNGLQYICELIDQIHAYNDLLTNWIQMRQGELSLQISTFELNDLFEWMRRAHFAYDQRQIQLNIIPTDLRVKADRALTLLMLNTLADNARKFTPPGGSVTIEAKEGETEDGNAYVELSITDTGVGISDDDINLILNHHVYDASTIGNRQIGDESQTFKGQKGFGFGLMNCKGVIQKYIKTNQLFRVCMLGIESKVGQGSRFFFRLPRVLSFLIAALFNSADINAENSIVIRQEAYRMADSVYYANVHARYSDALLYADSALQLINQWHRDLYPNDTTKLYLIQESGESADIIWLEKHDSIDFSLLIGLRNEIAVVALSKNDWDLYRYNNHLYTYLYKLANQDTSLEAYCQTVEHSQDNQRIALTLLVIFLIAAGLIAYFYYYRPKVLFRLDVSQLLSLNQHLFAIASANHDAPQTEIGQEPSDFRQIPIVNQLLDEAWLGINGIHYVNALHLNEDGSLEFDYGNEIPTANQRTLDQLLSRYFQLILAERVLLHEQQMDNLRMAEDEHRRSLYEETQLHVQNMIMDNCLSSIKHETMYYPGRIRQIAMRMMNGETNLLQTLSETTSYYKEIFSLLSAQAGQQSAALNFRRRTLCATFLLKYARHTFKLKCKRAKIDYIFTTLPSDKAAEDFFLKGDTDLLCFLIENIIEGTISSIEKKSEKSGGEEAVLNCSLSVENNNNFIRFTLTNNSVQLSEDDLHDLFSPDINRIPYMLAKQIIREHDIFLGHPGCRINAESQEEYGYKIWWTIPATAN